MRICSFAAIGALIYFIILPMMLDESSFTYLRMRIRHDLTDEDAYKLSNKKDLNISVVIEQGVERQRQDLLSNYNYNQTQLEMIYAMRDAIGLKFVKFNNDFRSAS